MKFKLHSEYGPAGDPTPKNGVVGVARSKLESAEIFLRGLYDAGAYPALSDAIFGAWARSGYAWRRISYG